MNPIVEGSRQVVMHGGRTAIPVAIFIVMALIAAAIGLALTALTIWAYCRIFRKAGYHWAFGLMILVPMANIIVPLLLAFSTWPIEKQLNQAKEPASQAG